MTGSWQKPIKDFQHFAPRRIRPSRAEMRETLKKAVENTRNTEGDENAESKDRDQA